MKCILCDKEMEDCVSLANTDGIITHLDCKLDLEPELEYSLKESKELRMKRKRERMERINTKLINIAKGKTNIVLYE
jgi:hypothetical protein